MDIFTFVNITIILKILIIFIITLKSKKFSCFSYWQFLPYITKYAFTLFKIPLENLVWKD